MVSHHPDCCAIRAVVWRATRDQEKLAVFPAARGGPLPSAVITYKAMASKPAAGCSRILAGLKRGPGLRTRHRFQTGGTEPLFLASPTDQSRTSPLKTPTRTALVRSSAMNRLGPQSTTHNSSVTSSTRNFDRTAASKSGAFGGLPNSLGGQVRSMVMREGRAISPVPGPHNKGRMKKSWKMPGTASEGGASRLYHRILSTAGLTSPLAHTSGHAT